MSTVQRRTGPGEAVENYAKAIYALQQRAGTVVTTNALADRLGVTAASASGMVKKLCTLGLVRHEPYRELGATHFDRLRQSQSVERLTRRLEQ